MIKTIKTPKKLMLVAALAVAFTSCEELAELCNIQSEDLAIVETYNQHLNEAVFVYQIIDKALRDSDLSANDSATIDGVYMTTSNDSIIIDFGNGTICSDNKVRKGKILAYEPADYMIAGSQASALLSDYYVNNKAYTGNLTLTNSTTNPNNPEVSLGVTNFASADESLNVNLTSNWLTGFETINDHQDDSYSLSGAVMMTAAGSAELAGTITTPLLINQSCPYLFEEGVIEVVPSGLTIPQVELDFLEGDCDNLFKITIDCSGNNLSFTYPIR